MSGAADERVRVGGQRVLHVVPHQRRRRRRRRVVAAASTCPLLLLEHDRAQDVGHHLAVCAPCSRKRSQNQNPKKLSVLYCFFKSEIS